MKTKKAYFCDTTAVRADEAKRFASIPVCLLRGGSRPRFDKAVMHLAAQTVLDSFGRPPSTFLAHVSSSAGRKGMRYNLGRRLTRTPSLCLGSFLLVKKDVSGTRAALKPSCTPLSNFVNCVACRSRPCIDGTQNTGTHSRTVLSVITLR